MKVRANGLSLPDLDTLAALETGRYWTPAKRPGEPLYRPAINNGYWAEDILTNGLVLYVPLWLYSGAKFPSVDAYHHTCTVTGATWGLQGRDFPGTNGSVIDCGVTIGNTFGNNVKAITVELWFKTDTTNDNDGLLDITDFVNAYGEFVFYLQNDLLYFGMHNINFTQSVSFTDKTTWHHLIATYDGVNGKAFLDLTQIISQAYSLGLNLSGLKTIIGGYYNTPYTFDGKQGEVRIYNRALSLAEIQHNYKATRWRYA